MSYINNEAAYDRAIARNIKLNAQKTRRAVWMKLEGAARVNEFLYGFGEFDASYREDGYFKALHPVVKAVAGSDFYHAMQDNIMSYGGLTERQNAAVLLMIARCEAKVSGFVAKRAEEAAVSNWIGTVGKREVFTVTIRHIIVLNGVYGTSYLHILNDAAGNVVIYKGTKCLGDNGETLTVKATVTEHGEREGVKQTKIARPA